MQRIKAWWQGWDIALKIPNSNIQIPNKLQFLKFKILEFVWNLGFKNWDLLIIRRGMV
jgi:hypothetical protein